MIFDGQPQPVSLRFEPQLGPLICELEWHPRQQLHTAPDGTIEFSMTIPVNPELIAWILNWGKGCLVLAPVPLVDQVRREVRQLYEAYWEESPSSS